MTSWDHVMPQREAIHSTRTKVQTRGKAGALDSYKMEVSICSIQVIGLDGI